MTPIGARRLERVTRSDRTPSRLGAAVRRRRRTAVAILRPVRLIPAPITRPSFPRGWGGASAGCWPRPIVNNVGDGVVLAAGPLLVASQTHDPFLVSMALLSEYLPVLLFGVIGGVGGRPLRPAADGHRRQPRARLRARRPGRDDPRRRRRASASSWSCCSSSERRRRSPTRRAARSCRAWSRARTWASANARMQGGFLLTNQLVAPPIGAFLFAIGDGDPVRDQRRLLRARRRPRLARRHERQAGGTRAARACAAEMAEGLRWLLGHPPMRTLALTIFAFNITFGAAWSVLVLYAGQRLGMDAVGLRAADDGGGGRRRDRDGVVRPARAALQARRHHAGRPDHRDVHPPVAGPDDVGGVALATLVVFGAHAFVWGTTSTVVRQRAVPDALLGRVGGVYRVAIVGGLVIGTPIGGLLAQRVRDHGAVLVRVRRLGDPRGRSCGASSTTSSTRRRTERPA